MLHRASRSIRLPAWAALSAHTRCLSGYTSNQVGVKGTIDSRLVFVNASSGAAVSPWHDIPLRPVGEKSSYVFHFVNEIPKGTRAKMEIAGEEARNPIKQDVKNGNLRFYHFDSLVNYGCIPQTWEDPRHIDPATQHGGDNDPIDVCEIGSRVAAVGDVYPVKVLGVLGMIDDGETDWKVIAIATDDPLANKLHGMVNILAFLVRPIVSPRKINKYAFILDYLADFLDLDDLHAHAPDTVATIRNWFRDYKIPDGKPPSAFAFDGRAQSRVRRNPFSSLDGMGILPFQPKIWEYLY
ncbi:hypothetical protein, variant 1 [Aphanomyces astaci]|uniref:inorganic diphosphatase n=1 Tax=Aphanomyces astaci TaxID=112090 RepID=W4GHE1_APHAT|nr:hypothetical protein, variant 1 [Aphanomyces astaci]ETV78388.1 hypothetical protein, variant 1 [Aphanomyces astaci]|eukprot:XP_009831969.1 hypothetical protein, variant 1 [Aphanomyces astaci]